MDHHVRVASSRRARRSGRTLRIAAALALASSCGGDTTGPPPPGPGSIAIEPEALSFSWVGDSRRLLAQVRDEAGVVLAFPAVSWSSTNPSAVTVSPGGLAVAAGAGQATITALSGAATASASATVSLVPDSMLKVSGDAQRGTAGSPLPDSLVTEVRDRGGTPIPGAAVSWTVSGSDGVITSSRDQTDGRGRASARWTLGGAEGSQAVTARAGTVEVRFTAVATAPLEASMDPLSASVQVGQSADFALVVSGGDPDQPERWTCASPDVGVVSVELVRHVFAAVGGEILLPEAGCPSESRQHWPDQIILGLALVGRQLRREAIEQATQRGLEVCESLVGQVPPVAKLGDRFSKEVLGEQTPLEGPDRRHPRPSKAKGTRLTTSSSAILPIVESSPDRYPDSCIQPTSRRA